MRIETKATATAKSIADLHRCLAISNQALTRMLASETGADVLNIKSYNKLAGIARKIQYAAMSLEDAFQTANGCGAESPFSVMSEPSAWPEFLIKRDEAEATAQAEATHKRHVAIWEQKRKVEAAVKAKAAAKIKAKAAAAAKKRKAQ